MDRNIVFEWKGVQYEVGQEAYDKSGIILPDGRMLQPNAWGESLPPKPFGLHEVPHVFSGNTPEEIAEAMNGVVAIAV